MGVVCRVPVWQDGTEAFGYVDFNSFTGYRATAGASHHRHVAELHGRGLQFRRPSYAGELQLVDSRDSSSAL